jgi:hypothetical protein
VGFAGHDVGITRFFEAVGEGDEAWAGTDAVFDGTVYGGVEAGEKAASGGAANGGGGVTLGEHNAFGGKAVGVRLRVSQRWVSVVMRRMLGCDIDFLLKKFRNLAQ